MCGYAKIFSEVVLKALAHALFAPLVILEAVFNGSEGLQRQERISDRWLKNDAKAQKKVSRKGAVVMTGVWYEIEELIPAEKAIGGKAYWFPLQDGDRFPYQEADFERAFVALKKTREAKRNTRLVKVIKEIVA